MSYIAIATTVIGAGLAAVQAQQQNQAVKRSIQSQRQAATVQSRQVQEQARIRAQQRLADLHRTEGALRVAGAAAGVGVGGSYGQLQDAAALGAQLDLNIIGRNATNNEAAVVSETQARIAQLNSQISSPILAGIAGGLQGYAAGAGINSSLAASAAATDAANTAANAAARTGFESSYGFIGPPSPGTLIP